MNLLTTTEAAEARGVAVETIRLWCRSGMRFHRMGKTIMIEKRDLMEWQPKPKGWPKKLSKKV